MLNENGSEKVVNPIEVFNRSPNSDLCCLKYYLNFIKLWRMIYE